MSNGTIVHSTSDSLGNILVVDFPRYRVLSFDSIYEQSGYYLEKPYALVHEYTRIMMLALGFIKPTHITLLGLGGGSLLRSLHHCLSDCEFHVVELRPKVYEVAKYYFDIPDDERVQISIEDAALHIKASKDASTDIIFADMYDAYHMSPIQGQQLFIKNCWRTLSEKGWLVINYHRLPDVSTPLFKCLLAHFRTIMLCTGEYGNHIILACKSHVIDYEQAPIQLKIIEGILGESLSPLLHRITHLAA